MTLKLWTMWQTDELISRTHHLSIDCDPPRISIHNADEFVEYLENDWSTTVEEPGTGRKLLQPPPPTIQLVVTEPGFAPDLFIHETFYISAALRDAMALHPDDAQWFPVDASRSTPEVQAKRYAMMHPTREADPLDYDRSEGVWLDLVNVMGEPYRIWEARAPNGELRPARLVWRDNFVPPAPYFFSLMHGEFVTDELADRVRRAGLEGVAFVDASNS